MFQQKFTSTVHVSDAELAELYDTMAQVALANGQPEKEKIRRDIAPRMPFCHRNIGLYVEHPGGGEAAYYVCTRNLTTGGVAFVHGGYIHQHTPCKVLLPTIWGGEETIRGKVVWCRLVSGTIHEAAIQFEHEIELWRFLEGEEAGALYSGQPIDQLALVGEVLLLDDLEVECKICAHHLAPTNLNLTTCTTLDEAIEKISAQSFDAVLCDLNLGEADGVDACRSIRQTSFHGPLLVMTGESNPARIREVKQAGADVVVKKPYDPKHLLAILSEWLLKGGEGSASGPMYSPLESDPKAAALLDEYFEFVKELIAEMNRAIMKDDVAKTRRLCQDLRETAGGYGFPSLTIAAEHAVIALDSSCSITESLPAVQKVEIAARLMRRGVPPR